VKSLYLSLLACSVLSASEITNLLNSNYNKLFDLELQKSYAEKDFDTKSWISPIMLTWQRDWNNQITGEYKKSDSFSVSIDQPIFKSGGIYYGIKFAKAKYNLNRVNTQKEKRALIVRAVEFLFKIKQSKINLSKLKLQLKNSKIDVLNTQELYSAGMLDGVALDTALAKEQQSEISLLNLEQTIQELKGAFAKISSKNPNRLKLPKLRLINEKEFLDKNLDIKVANASVNVKKYANKLTATKYMPTVSVGARYTKLSPKPIGTRDHFSNYSLRVSMPISVNVMNDLEQAKLDALIAKVNAKNTAHSAKEDYKIIKRKIAIINKQIRLSIKEAAIYKKLLNTTTKLYKAGQKSKNDVALLANSYKIKKLDAQIYRINKELELLKLYAKMR